MALFDLDDYKPYAGIAEENTTMDGRLEPICAMVDALVKKYTARDLELTHYINEVYDGPGTACLTLNQYPIHSMHKVMIEEDEIVAITPTERFDGEDGYWVKDLQSGILYRSNLWPRGRGLIIVDYSAGYEETPSDILVACYDLVTYFKNVSPKSGIVSESLGAYSYSVMNSLSALGGDFSLPVISAKLILDMYRRGYQELIY